MTANESTPIDTILVATDFSRTAESGLDWAIEIAKVHRASIELVHALLFPNQMGDYLPSPPDMSEELRKAALGRLDESAGRAREEGIEVRPELLLGLPSQAILEATRKAGADLIVIGTRGLSGIRHLLLGSTAERVVQHAECPVLTVHPGDIDKHRAVGTVLVPTDFSHDAEVALQAARELLPKQAPEARMILLHAYHLPFEYTAYGTIPTSLNYLQDVEGEALEKLRQKAAELEEEDFDVEVLAKEGYPPDVIVDQAEESGADLIVMGNKGRSGLAHLLLGSTTERVVQHAGCPVLTVRCGDDE